MSLTKKDFQSDNEVRWCPGCGDYAILSTVQKTLAELDLRPEQTVFVSGIGCAARFPYYMNTYGLHTIHGRAPAFASGLKLANPNLEVFVVTGDGDGLSIGASHLLHLLRRNININVLLFNNQIYGLTKGQYSPTSLQGQKAKSTPFGSLEEPVNPIVFALAAGAGFVARSIDNDAAHLSQTLKAAIAHQGTSFVEIMQTCVVFNDGAFDHLRDQACKKREVLYLKDGEPLLYNQGQQGIYIDPASLMPRVVDHSQTITRHQIVQASAQAGILATLKRPDFPTPIGIFRALERPTYEILKNAQDSEISSQAKTNELSDLLRGNNTWEIYL